MSSLPSNSILRRMVPGLILGFVVIIGLMLLGDIQQVSRAILQFHWGYFLIALGFTLLNYTLRFLKWHFYLAQIGVRRLTILQSLRLFVAGFPLAFTPGKVGEVFKAIWLMRQTGVPVARGVSVVVAERISDGLAVLVLSVLGVIAYPQFWPVFLAILAALLAIVILSQIRPAAYWLLDQGEKIKILYRVSQVLREFYEGSFTLFRPKATFLAVLLGTISWLGEGIGFFFILVGLGLPPTTQLLAMAVFVLAFSTIVGAASALPGGIGAAEASIAGLLTLTLHQNPALATSATVLIRLATLWFGVGLGLLVWLLSPGLFGLSNVSEVAVEA
jgi:glycosyltransferase 2 family protein